MRKTSLFLVPLLLLAACENVRLEAPVAMDVPPLQAHTPEVRTIDVEHYALELNVDPIARGIDGRLTARFVSNAEGLPRVTFDLTGLKVYNVVDSNGGIVVLGTSANVLVEANVIANSDVGVHVNHTTTKGGIVVRNNVEPEGVPANYNPYAAQP